uniref:Hflx-type G domain-containing protein n=1 Tax=Syphacia muris TaxID=451379 RepID=A0A0N5AXZ0_9BILA
MNTFNWVVITLLRCVIVNLPAALFLQNVSDNLIRQFSKAILLKLQKALSVNDVLGGKTVTDGNSDCISSNFIDDNDTQNGRISIKDNFKNGHRLLVVHPKIRWGKHSASALTTTEHQVEEAVALVKTIPNFSVANTVVVGTDYSTISKRIWGTGRIERLVEEKEKCRATAVMINVAILSPMQQVEMSRTFRTPVFDRYNITLLIFKLYARTKDAWLQIELASIPYLRCNKSEFLRIYEHTIQKKITASVEEKRDTILSLKQKRAALSVAVVGYTNAGKSSLIKRLTGRDLYVEDRLFATLDTSEFFCRLPSGHPIYLADTIGFISDLPTYLFASFRATLSCVEVADLLIVVEDMSDPNFLAQRETVLKTLLDLHVKDEVISNIIFVGNKIDKLSCLPKDVNNTIFVSCVDGTGFSELISQIDKLGGLVKRILKIRPDSEAFDYLLKGSFLIDKPVPSPDGNYIMCTFNMNEADFAKFSSRFNIKKRKRKPIIALEVKAELERLDELQPKPDWRTFRWYLKCRCSNCGEEPKIWHFVIPNETITFGKSDVNFLEKCKICGRINSLVVLMDSFEPYTAKMEGEFQAIIKFDCRGLEPTDFDPRGQWWARCTESGAIFSNIDLTEREWADYDEKVQCCVEVKEFTTRFVQVKK